MRNSERPSLPRNPSTVSTPAAALASALRRMPVWVNSLASRFSRIRSIQRQNQVFFFMVKASAPPGGDGANRLEGLLVGLVGEDALENEVGGLGRPPFPL